MNPARMEIPPCEICGITNTCVSFIVSFDPCLSCGGEHPTCVRCYNRMNTRGLSGNIGNVHLDVCPKDYLVAAVLEGKTNP